MTPFRETLVAPDGRTVTTTSPGEYNDLRYGRGYRPPRADPAPEPPPVPVAPTAPTKRATGDKPISKPTDPETK
jgi:hypothetical protein